MEGKHEAARAPQKNHRRSGTGMTALKVLGTLLAIGVCTALIKATAVVGYVAVQDLTKMGDIVRSRTYEAFFPLIAVAVIYFILAGLLTFFVSRIELHINPRRRSRESILKGVQQSRTAEPKALQEGGDGNGKGPDRGD